MKTLLIIAISIGVLFGFSTTGNSQFNIKPKGSKEKYARDMSDEEIKKYAGFMPYGATAEFVSEYHKQHFNEVVFTKTELKPSEVNDATTATSFSINDNLYMHILLSDMMQSQIIAQLDENGEFKESIYYNTSFKKWYEGSSSRDNKAFPQYNQNGEFFVELTLDGTLIGKEQCILSGSKFKDNRTFITFALYADASKTEVTSCWRSLINSLSTGNHKLEVEVYAGSKYAGNQSQRSKSPIAKGSCTLVKKDGETFNPSTGKKWADFKATQTDKVLTKQVLVAAQSYIKSKGYKEQIIDVKITGGWWVTRHAISGIILTRYLSALCLEKWPDGSCKVREYKFIESYDGKNYQSSPYCWGAYKYGGGADGYSIKPQTIDCE